MALKKIEKVSKMTQQSSQIKITQLCEQIRPAIRFLAEKLLADLDDNLISLCVVGSSVTDDFHPRFSDINTVVVTRSRSHELLKTIAGYGSAMGKKKLRAPLLMTPEYIQQSPDVFGVEFLDFQLNHVVVFGPDPFTELTMGKEDVRLQCERQLKAALIKLRQGYIRCLGKPKPVGQLLIECVGELAVLLRALLWLIDCERPKCAQPTLVLAAEKFSFEADKIIPLFKLKQQHQQPPSEQAERLFENLYQAIDHLARKVDQLGTAP